MFFECEEDPEVPPPQGQANFVRGDSKWSNEQMPANDFVDMPSLDGTIPSSTFHADMTPGDIFQRMIRAEVFFNRWSENTNLKYEQWKEGGGKDRKDDEDDETTKVPNSDRVADGYCFGIRYTYVTVKTMYMFLSMCMFMTIMALPNLQDYFSPTAYALKPAFNWAADAMSGISYHRFQQIKKFMCYNVVTVEDIETEGPRKGRTKDKLHRVRPLITLLQATFAALVKPGFLWSIDEGMVPYRGRFCPCKVYMKDKPHKFGIKIWMLCCAVTGFCFMFKIYEGRGDVFPGETPEFLDLWGLGERVVLYFASFVAKGSHIFTDRFFTTPALCIALRNMGIWITGTAMKNKQGIDQPKKKIRKHCNT